MKVSIGELDKILKQGGEPDERLRRACSRHSLKEMIEHQKQISEQLEKEKKKHQKIKDLSSELYQKISNGNFDKEYPELDVKERDLF